jgi:hypothetical protein
MLNQCLENMGEGLLHACISIYSVKQIPKFQINSVVHGITIKLGFQIIDLDFFCITIGSANSEDIHTTNRLR